eukprot:NODE_410_length_1590_cov_294.908795.p1 GENE.NODE_410_length_1590_cov_294.908795~~NODE_410_length_1590_cov_294.908795.p1  ORF type:complete len:461 (-),score=139.46 NODE_410_length_1590_cov_294.908795:128-1510(-)
MGIYIIAIFMTSTIGQDDHTGDHGEEFVAEMGKLFSTLEMSLLTVFRCFIGSCDTSFGTPIVAMLTDVYGWPFSLGYCAATVVVEFGLFNLIMAIYLEKTLACARSGADTAKAVRHEAFNIARDLRQLLTMVCAAQHAVNTHTGHRLDKGMLGKVVASASDADFLNFDIVITREVFLVVQEHPLVNSIFDSLGVPPDRKGLFEVLDADQSGALELRELVQGLLKVSGDAQQIDVLGGALGMRAVLDLQKEQNEQIQSIRMMLDDLCSEHFGMTPLPPQPSKLRRDVLDSLIDSVDNHAWLDDSQKDNANRSEGLPGGMAHGDALRCNGRTKNRHMSLGSTLPELGAERLAPALRKAFHRLTMRRSAGAGTAARTAGNGHCIDAFPTRSSSSPVVRDMPEHGAAVGEAGKGSEHHAGVPPSLWSPIVPTTPAVQPEDVLWELQPPQPLSGLAPELWEDIAL